MKSIALTILILLFNNPVTFASINNNQSLSFYEFSYTYSDNEIEEKKKIITEIVDSYRKEIITRYGDDVKLIFSPVNAFQMTGGHKGGKLEITVYAKALIKFTKMAIVTATCHEVGHILGTVTLKDAGPSRYDPRDSVEGEADYFAGSCSRKYFNENKLDSHEYSSYCLNDDYGCNQAVTAARENTAAIYIDGIDENLASNEIYIGGRGINPTYPNKNCRLLSMIYGIQGLERPRCWYNPK